MSRDMTLKEFNPHQPVPKWFDDGVTIGECYDIALRGCKFSAYMPACYFEDAIETMSNHGSDVINYIMDIQPGTFPPAKCRESWGMICSWYLMVAIEMYCQDVTASYDERGL